MFEKRQSFVILDSVKCSVNSALFASDSNRFLRDSFGLALHPRHDGKREETNYLSLNASDGSVIFGEASYFCEGLIRLNASSICQEIASKEFVSSVPVR